MFEAIITNIRTVGNAWLEPLAFIRRHYRYGPHRTLANPELKRPPTSHGRRQSVAKPLGS